MEDFTRPDGIVDGVLIDTKTGLLARRNGTIPDSELRYEILLPVPNRKSIHLERRH